MKGGGNFIFKQDRARVWSPATNKEIWVAEK
jgi:hypothetical protein